MKFVMLSVDNSKIPDQYLRSSNQAESDRFGVAVASTPDYLRVAAADMTTIEVFSGAKRGELAPVARFSISNPAKQPIVCLAISDDGNVIAVTMSTGTAMKYMVKMFRRVAGTENYAASTVIYPADSQTPPALRINQNGSKVHIGLRYYESASWNYLRQETHTFNGSQYGYTGALTQHVTVSTRPQSQFDSQFMVNEDRTIVSNRDYNYSFNASGMLLSSSIGANDLGELADQSFSFPQGTRTGFTKATANAGIFGHNVKFAIRDVITGAFGVSAVQIPNCANIPLLVGTDAVGKEVYLYNHSAKKIQKVLLGADRLATIGGTIDLPITHSTEPFGISNVIARVKIKNDAKSVVLGAPTAAVNNVANKGEVVILNSR